MRFLVIIGVLSAVLGLRAPAASAVTSGLTYSEDTVFTVGETSVNVVTTAVMSNTSQETRDGNTIFYSYFDTFLIVVPTAAEDLSIESRGRSLPSTTSAIDTDFSVRTVPLPSALQPGESRTFTVSYTLPAGEIRGDGLFFSNPAHHAFPLWSFSDPGTGSLLLRVPDDAEMNEFGGSLRRVGSNDDGFVEWEPWSFAVPEDFFTYVTVTADDQLNIDTFTVVGEEIELRTWPGDELWTVHAKGTLLEGLPELERQIGLPIPDQGTLEVTESVTPYFHGYAGWYDQVDTSIEVGNELDRTVMIHELSHAWFNNGLFRDRWVNEGLAEEFTWQTQTALGWETDEEPARPDTSAPNAVALAEWGRSFAAGVDDTDFHGREAYGYHTSWYVIRGMVDIVGIDGMRDVLATADSRTMAYLDADEQRTQAVSDWRHLLDLASVNASPGQEAELDQLFVDYVARERDLALLDARSAARDRYREFTEGDWGWQVPIDIRVAMELWRFDTAGQLMASASEVHERFGEVRAYATEMDLELSDASQISYERFAPDFGLALAVLAEQEAAIDEVTTIRRSATRALTTEERWGLRGVSRAPYADHAEAAFVIDDTLAIANTRDSLDALFVAAIENGRERLFWAKFGGGSGAGILVLGAWMTVRRRRRGAEEDDAVDLEELGEPNWSTTARAA